MGALRKPAVARWEAEMAELFALGSYVKAAALYDEHAAQASTVASLLRARIHLRGDYSRALSLLHSIRVPGPGALSVERAMLLGVAYFLGADYEAADELLGSALEEARSLGDTELIAEVGYHCVRRFGMAGDTRRALEMLEIARTGKTLESRLNALHAESALQANDVGALGGTGTLMDLLRLIDPAETRFAEHRALATHSLAVRARELCVPSAIPEIERQLAGSQWPADFAHNRFQALKATGWIKALQGDYFNAFRFLKEATHSATTSAWQTMALCDRAILAGAIGELRWARQELSEAEELSQRVVWETCRDEESIALLLMAELYAPIDAARAAAFIGQFRRVGESSHARLLMKDERRRALIEYSSAIVDLALGNRKLAISRFTSAMRVYREVGYQWRAGRCALRLFDATRKTEYLDLAEELLRNYSSSWLGDELRARKSARGTGVALSPMRERVFRLLCEGRSNEEIAAIVGRSKATVANHAKAVLKRYGVSSRSALLAEAHKRGVL